MDEGTENVSLFFWPRLMVDIGKKGDSSGGHQTNEYQNRAQTFIILVEFHIAFLGHPVITFVESIAKLSQADGRRALSLAV